MMPEAYHEAQSDLRLANMTFHVEKDQNTVSRYRKLARRVGLSMFRARSQKEGTRTLIDIAGTVPQVEEFWKRVGKSAPSKKS